MGRLATISSVIQIFSVLFSYSTSAQHNVTFLIDTADVTQMDFDQVIDFVYNVTSQLTIGTNNTMVAVVTFNTNPTTQFNLDDYTDKSSLLNAINALKNVSLGHERNVHDALSHITTNIYTDTGGRRTEAESVVIVILYGQPSSITQTLFSALVLHDVVNNVYAIGIGDFVLDSTKNQDLTNIATNPDSDNVFHIINFAYLCHYVTNITEKIDPDISAFELNGCPEITTTTTTTTLPTTTVDITTSQDSTTTTVSTTIPTTTVNVTTGQDSTKTTMSTSASTNEVNTSPESTSVITTTYKTDMTGSNSLVILVAILSVLLFVVVIFAVVISMVYYLPKYRKKKRFENQIILIVNLYPDIKNGVGPSKGRYTERKNIHKNGYSSKFNAYLKVSMIRNGGVNGLR